MAELTLTAASNNSPVNETDSLSHSFYRDLVGYLDPEHTDPFNGQNTHILHYPVKQFVLTEPQASPGEGNLRESFQADWTFWLLFSAFALLTFTRYLYERRFKLVVSAVFSASAARQATGEKSIIHHQSFIFLLIVAGISGLLFVYEVIRFFNGDTAYGIQGIWMTLQICGAWMAWFLLRIFLVRTSGMIFRNQGISSEYIQNMFIFNIFSGVVLLPLLLLITYVNPEPFLYIALIFLSLMMLVRFARGFLIGLTDTKFSIFHLFLYLCTLEILPVLFIAKFAEKYFLE